MQHLKQETQNCVYQFLLSAAQDEKKLLEQLKAGFKRAIKWKIIDLKCLFSLKITI